ncbi:small multidrug efflux protein [Cryobacterium lactosi]|uniref:Small multidrug efflux protein n=1 Tax=Cryobacterium lactosi TaxID=1259202 RepID=A0A4V3IXV9_9MICO|nr:small multidrug efflux protein [Cryobacterium lactosi]TFD92097.1 small multidrug efflux protein [Cryobacterium lactosi]
MSNPVADLVAGFQELVGQVPDFLQPLIVAAAGAVPFIEGEISALIGILGGLHPLVAMSAGVLGNLTSVVLVVLLGSRIRSGVVARRSRNAPVPMMAYAGAVETGPVNEEDTAVAPEEVKPESKGRQKIRQWLIRFGVPGASILGPLAIPTHFTAAIFVASGISKGRVILWQAVAIVIWTGITTVSATLATLVIGT